MHQILLQHPGAFEFTEELLLFLMLHLHSGWFGNFLFNTEAEARYHLREKTMLSLWTAVLGNKDRFFNRAYCPPDAHAHARAHAQQRGSTAASSSAPIAALDMPPVVPVVTRARVVLWHRWYLRWQDRLWGLAWEGTHQLDIKKGAESGAWADKEQSPHCAGCEARFHSCWKRQHHCRSCGQVFCGRCSSHFRVVPTISSSRPSRCCTDCAAQIDTSYLEIMARHSTRFGSIASNLDGSMGALGVSAISSGSGSGHHHLSLNKGSGGQTLEEYRHNEGARVLSSRQPQSPQSPQGHPMGSFASEESTGGSAPSAEALLRAAGGTNSSRPGSRRKSILDILTGSSGVGGGGGGKGDDLLGEGGGVGAAGFDDGLVEEEPHDYEAHMSRGRSLLGRGTLSRGPSGRQLAATQPEDEGSGGGGGAEQNKDNIEATKGAKDSHGSVGSGGNGSVMGVFPPAPPVAATTSPRPRTINGKGGFTVDVGLDSNM